MKNDTPDWLANYSPSGQGLLWQSDYLWLNIISDGFIALAFILIPICQHLILRKNPGSPYRTIVTMFSIFIMACGASHLIEIWASWRGEYALLGYSKSLTALLSMSTVVILLISLRRLPGLTSIEGYQKLNTALEKKINDQNAATEKLAQTEQRLRVFLKQAPDAMVIVRASGQIEYSNDLMNTMYGYPPEGLDGKYVREIVPERLQHKLSAKHNDLYATDGAMWSTSGGEFTSIRKDGTEFPAELRVNVIATEEDGEVTMSTYRDLSERKAREADTYKDLFELAHVSRMSTVGQMASGLAHELNQPLTAISNNLYTSMAIQKKLANPNQELLEITQENYESAQRAGQIIKSLRQLVRKDDGNQRETDINKLVTSTIALISPEAKAANVNLTLALDSKLLKSSIDSVQIQQVLVNLGRNAIEACSSPEQSERVILITTELQEDASILVKVSDNGPGLSTEVKAELFSPNITTKETGMGLGLSICLSIIQAHGGKLWHVEDDGQGATFCFTLPPN
jgi:PAS domain S-box-containing protein